MRRGTKPFRCDSSEWSRSESSSRYSSTTSQHKTHTKSPRTISRAGALRICCKTSIMAYGPCERLLDDHRYPSFSDREAQRDQAIRSSPCPCRRHHHRRRSSPLSSSLRRCLAQVSEAFESAKG